jgi:hypothetical protein
MTLTRDQIEDRMFAFDTATNAVDGEDFETSSEVDEARIAIKQIRSWSWTWYVKALAALESRGG